MSGEEKKDLSLQRALTKDLGQLQARLELYENKLPEQEQGSEAWAHCKGQIDYYRAETSKVRTAVLELHKLAMAELKG